MLQRIDTDAVELGMFIERLEGSWLKHPFWRRRFVLTEEKHLNQLRNSSVEGVFIDITRGKVPAGLEPENPQPVEQARPASPGRTGISRGSLIAGNFAVDAPSRPPVVIPGAQEFGRAKAIAQRSEKVMSRVFLKARLGEKIKISDVEGVVDEIYESVASNPNTLIGILRCKEETGEVYRHALATCALMIALGRKMGLSNEDVRLAGLTGLLMDIGVGQLTQHLSEVEGDYRELPSQIAKQHVFFGHDIVAANDEIPESVVRGCLDHHERVDGSGYPAGLLGDQIGTFAKMAAVCDEFDYMVSGGFVEKALNPATALTNLSDANERYDDTVFSAFVESVGVYPIGTFVELESGLLAMVVYVDQEEPSQPMVRAFHSIRLDKPIKQQMIDLRFTYGTDKIVGTADLGGFDLPPVGELRKRLLANSYRDAA